MFAQLHKHKHDTGLGIGCISPPFVCHWIFVVIPKLSGLDSPLFGIKLSHANIIGIMYFYFKCKQSKSGY